MADRQTMQRFLAAATLVAAAIGLVTLTGGSDQEAAKAPSRQGPDPLTRRPALRATVIDGAGPLRQRPARMADAHRPEREDLQPGTTPSAADVGHVRRPLRNARRFVTTLLVFERDGATRTVRRALTESATPRLARFVVARAPRRVASQPPPAGRLVALEPLPGGSAQHLEVAATIARAGSETGLVLRLRHGGGVWRVTALR